MKLNWGHKIAIVYMLFMAFIIFMVVLSSSHDHQLVSENYYENEMAVQGTIDASKNMAGAPFNVLISETDGAILLAFADFKGREVSEGTVNLYKPDNRALDEEHPLVLNISDEMQIMPKGYRGRYKVSVSFVSEGVRYYKEQNIIL
jgi:hypothetical protein